MIPEYDWRFHESLLLPFAAWFGVTFAYWVAWARRLKAPVAARILRKALPLWVVLTVALMALPFAPRLILFLANVAYPVLAFVAVLLFLNVASKDGDNLA